jgi:tryptophan synthase alpha chain
MKAHKLAPVFLAAPTSTDERLRQIARHSRGFVYAISRTGITGARQELAGDARSLVERLRAHTKLPIAVGFGVSTPEQFAEVGGFADAAVVGSAIVQCIEQNRGREVSEFLSSLPRMCRIKSAGCIIARLQPCLTAKCPEGLPAAAGFLLGQRHA